MHRFSWLNYEPVYLIQLFKNQIFNPFIEPKGDDRLLEDKWKEEMLQAINQQENVIYMEGEDNIRLIGIRFFADKQRDEFINDFSQKLYDGKPLEDNLLSH